MTSSSSDTQCSYEYTRVVYPREAIESCSRTKFIQHDDDDDDDEGSIVIRCDV